MNPFNRIIAFLVVGLCAGTASTVLAIIPIGTEYTFSANPGLSTEFNGSTITVAGTTLLNWDLVDTAAPAGFTTVTPANSTVVADSITSSSSAWAGFFDIASPFNPSLDLATFDGTNTPTGGALDATYAAPQQEANIQDPPGIWTAVGTVVSTPDAESSFDLLVSAMGALCVGRFVYRARRN